MNKPILLIDAGFRNMGWAIIDSGEIIAHGVIVTKPASKKSSQRVADADADACDLLFRELANQVRNYSPKAMVVEMPSAGAQGARANRGMGMATAVVACLAAAFSLPHEYVTPQMVKDVAKAAKGAVTKDMVAAAVYERWPLLSGLSEHETDAIAAYLAAENSSLVRLINAN